MDMVTQWIGRADRKGGTVEERTVDGRGGGGAGENWI